ncbi:Flp family type IVb pilin [Aeromicrobium senzhongii]|uniref:Flp family type IVb pilin n=1 Tax=Aeromicrobium senzhongii TaxID=2663859 RepID=A0ABX6SY22_9ACTN|nr:Flp family type IVb pilin [Aeromicrobium senzhongii]QNL95998.1 Flp family type IVb pilin [Aeromicrobium senzhongii]
MQPWIGSSPAERGASATEYALLVAGVAVILVGVIVFFGESLAASWLGVGALL